MLLCCYLFFPILKTLMSGLYKNHGPVLVHKSVSVSVCACVGACAACVVQPLQGCCGSYVVSCGAGFDNAIQLNAIDLQQSLLSAVRLHCSNIAILI